VCVYIVCIRENREFRSWGTAAAQRRMLREVPGDYLRDDVLRLCDCVCVYLCYCQCLIRAENDSDIAPAWDICGGGGRGMARGVCRRWVRGWVCSVGVGGAAGTYTYLGARAYSRQKSPPPRHSATKSTLTPMCKGLGRVRVCVYVCLFCVRV